MLPFRIYRLKTSLHNFFLNHYHLVIIVSTIVASLTGYFHLQLYYYDHDFLYWCNSLSELYKRYEFLFLATMATVLLIKLLVTFLLFAVNTGPMEWFDDLTRLEVKKRYADFLFIRLVSEISQIKERELRSKAIISVASFIRAHEEIQEKIARFRKDARKLFQPNEVEASLPPEEVYDTEEEQLDDKYAHLKIEEEVIKKMVNP
ncbi:unnamed protein product [Hermetia illucens]|uniref:Uncharacterized protein n=1 Tax=Hermetia illucens TaxID=343691 RepID=A0A7R8V1X5_HERIL|nr:uncharacterized protein LOC119657586 [Hermetia illucens]CAD7091340.1 unnamed protein product [Hermetia illucens]